MGKRKNNAPSRQYTGVRIIKDNPFNFSFSFDTSMFDCTVSIRFRGDRKEGKR